MSDTVAICAYCKRVYARKDGTGSPRYCTLAHRKLARRRRRVMARGPVALRELLQESTWRHKDGSVRVDHMDAQEGDYFGPPPIMPIPSATEKGPTT